jgi:hypothetical protein
MRGIRRGKAIRRAHEVHGDARNLEHSPVVPGCHTAEFAAVGILLGDFDRGGGLRQIARMSRRDHGGGRMGRGHSLGGIESSPGSGRRPLIMAQAPLAAVRSVTIAAAVCDRHYNR